MPNLLFEKDVSFLNVSANNDVDFSGCIFVQPISFQAGSICGTFTLSKAVLVAGGSFTDVRFRKLVNFSFASLPTESRVEFNSRNYPEGMNFAGVALLGKLSFIDAHFLGDSFFNLINPEPGPQAGELSFKDSVFEGKAYFDRVRLAELGLGDKDYHRPVVFKKEVTFAGL